MVGYNGNNSYYSYSKTNSCDTGIVKFLSITIIIIIANCYTPNTLAAPVEMMEPIIQIHPLYTTSLSKLSKGSPS